MAKELVTYVWCDNQEKHGETRVEGRPRRVAVDDGATYESDLCDPCDEEILGPVRRLLQDCGQPLMKTPSTTRRRREASPEEITQWCPDCNRGFKNLVAVGIHRSKAHGYVSPQHARRRAAEAEEALDLEAVS